MERPSDAPFFVEKPDNTWRRQNFGLIQGSGQDIPSLAGIPLFTFVTRRAQMENSIMDFFDKVSLGHEKINQDLVDIRFLRSDLERHIEQESENLDEEEKRAMRLITLEKVASFCSYNLHLNLRKLTEEKIVTEESFFNVHYWSKVKNIIYEAIEISARSLAVSSIVFSDETPDPVA